MILSHFSFAASVGLQLHRSLLFACRASNAVTQCEVVWQARLSILAVHLGLASVARPRFVVGAAGYSLEQFGPGVVPRQFELDAPLTAAAASAAPSVARIGSRVSSASDAASLVWRLEMRSASQLRNPDADAPLRHAIFSVDDATATAAAAALRRRSFAERVRYVFLLVKARCCVCGINSCRSRTPQEVKRGFEFQFAADSNDVRPWSGLRICVACCQALQLRVTSTSAVAPANMVEPPAGRDFRFGPVERPVATAKAAVTAAAQRRQRDDEQQPSPQQGGLVTLGLVLALPLDGEEQRKKRAVLGRLDFRGDALQQVLPTACAKLCDPVGAVAALRAQLLAQAKR